MAMQISKSKTVIVLLSISVFIFSHIVGPYYVAGDQTIYRRIYEGLKSLNLTEGYVFYIQNIASLEYIHFILSWLACRILDKDLFMALSNSVLAYSAIILLRKWRVSILVAGLLVLTNYYMLGLYFAAERLKFAILFLILSLICIERTKFFFLFAFIAVISHVQVAIVYGCMLVVVYTKKLIQLYTTNCISGDYLLLTAAGIIPLALMAQQFVSKFDAYYAARDVTNLLRTSVFFALALWYSKKRSEACLLFLPLFVVVQLVGGHRVNMFGYLFFLYYALPVRRGFNLGVLVTSIYFIGASVQFILRVIYIGDAFGTSTVVPSIWTMW